MILSCPNCKSLLSHFEHSLKCSAGHSFDQAKAGYFNLLLPNQKKTIDPGDSKEMIKSRESFLSNGHYDFLIEKLNALLKINHTSNEMNLLDIGCGSGYYTRALFSETRNIQKTGLDISKNSIEVASKKDKDSVYIVASAFNLPITNASVDFIINVFSPIALNEADRVLNENGKIYKVIPGPYHMREIAELVYDNFKPHHANFEEEVNSGNQFVIYDQISISKNLEMDKNSVQEMIAMTPYRYKFKDEQFNKLTYMNVTVSFQIMILQKTGYSQNEVGNNR